VAADEYDKDDVRDFVLWKAAKPEDATVGAVWDTQWGPGRPGWHIECSAMSMQELGETFDIHLGGVDLVFPHHEDEIAQSEGATGKPFVRYWLHGEFLLLEGGKMAKSTGNIFNVQDLVERGVKPSSVRYLYLTAHYRSKLNFTFEGLASAGEAVRRVRGTRDRLRDHPAARDPDPADTPTLHAAADEVLAAFAEAMDEDLNTSVGLATLHRLAGAINTRLEELGTRPISHAEQAAAPGRDGAHRLRLRLRLAGRPRVAGGRGAGRLGGGADRRAPGRPRRARLRHRRRHPRRDRGARGGGGGHGAGAALVAGVVEGGGGEGGGLRLNSTPSPP
jgi:cysteinyl-tRNA synthetase